MKQSLDSAWGRFAALASAALFAGCSTLPPSGPFGAPGTSAPSQSARKTPDSGAPAQQPDLQRPDVAGTATAPAAPADAGVTAQTEPAVPSTFSGTMPPVDGAGAASAPVFVPVPAPVPAQAAPPAGDLWERIRVGFAMPPLNTPLVASKEKYYLERPEYLQRMFDRAGKYLYFIVAEVEKRGMPTELALLPFIESAMNPVAMSSAKAAGLWQFIPSTGRVYNLSQNWWVDNRRDVVESTQAALDYLQKIYEMHNRDWFLALASYNWGENAVARAVRNNQARGRSADYLSLSMPAETRHYIPKLMAIKNIIANAGALGITLPPMPNRPYFVTIEKTRPIDLKLAARFAGMTVEEFVALNPAHNRPVIAASKNNKLKLPIDRVDAFLEAVDKHGEANKPLASWQPYTLKPAESLDSLAARQGVAVAELRTANGLRQGQQILPGTRILVPHSQVNDETQVESFVAPRVVERVDHPPAYYKVSKRDTIDRVAHRFGVAVATLMNWNRLGKATVRPGQSLLVRQPYTQTVVTAENGARHVLASSSRAPVSHAAEESIRPERASVRQSRSTRNGFGIRGLHRSKAKAGRATRMAVAH